MQFLDLNFVVTGIRMLMAMICQFVYPLISNIYSLFINISKVSILSGQFQPIYQRVTLILTIIMIFYVTFQCVKYIVQPDAMTDKEKGAANIVYKMIAVVVLIAFVPTIFDYAYKLQNVIIDQNVIGKVILGTNTDVNPSELGANFSASLLNISYRIDESKKDEECGDIACGTLVNMNINMLAKQNELPYLTTGLDATVKENAPVNAKDEIEVPAIDFEFNGFLAVVLGIFVAYILVLYCVDVGVRWAQLIYLQIIAPIPIIGFLSPKKDGIFQKWMKQCTTTYLDLFLRNAIIYFILLICSMLLDVFHNPTSEDLLSAIDPNLKTWVFIFLVMGLLLFAKKAPKMLSELFPKTGAASGNFGLSTKDRGFAGASRVVGGVVGGAAGALVGATTGALQGWRRRKSLDKQGVEKGVGAGIWGATKGIVSGAVGGATRGIYNGSKKGNMIKNVSAGTKNQVKASQRFGNREENGYTLGHQIQDKFNTLGGFKSRTQVLEEQKKPIKQQNEIYDKIFQSNKAQRDEAKKHALEEGKSLYSGEYKSAVARAAALRDDAATKNEFKVGKFKTRDEAYDAYVDAVKDARQSVIKQNFYDQNGNFNTSAYEDACNRAAKKVNEQEYYDQVSKYKTQAEAKAAYEKALQEADSQVDAAEKKAINDYIDNGEWDAATGTRKQDTKIMQLKNELKAEIEAYNVNSTKDRKADEISIDSSSGNITRTYIDSNGQEQTETFNADGFHKYAKAQAAKKSENMAKITNIDAEIQKIKNETEGSADKK